MMRRARYSIGVEMAIALLNLLTACQLTVRNTATPAVATIAAMEPLSLIAATLEGDGATVRSQNDLLLDTVMGLFINGDEFSGAI